MQNKRSLVAAMYIIDGPQSIHIRYLVHFNPVYMVKNRTIIDEKAAFLAAAVFLLLLLFATQTDN